MMEDYVRDFYVFSYFGKSYEEMKQDKEDLVMQCAKRAYLDLNRTLSFANEEKSDRESFRISICEIIYNYIENLISDEDLFDCRHHRICSRIGDEANKEPCLLSERFNYGQAQKWLNMTLKYMLLLNYGEGDPNFKKIKEKLHVPIDHYVLKIAAGGSGTKAARDNKQYWLKASAPIRHEPIDSKSKTYQELCTKIEPFKKQILASGYSDTEKCIPWSKWSDVDYLLFLKEIRDKFEEWKRKDAKYRNWTLIDWEGQAWIAQARLEQDKKSNSGRTGSPKER